MDKQRTITDLAEDAMDEADYKGRINFLVAGLMFADPDIDKEQVEKNKQRLKELMQFCQKGNTDEEKNAYLSRTAERIAEYLV